MAKTRRAYTGASVSSTTSSAIAASGTTSFTVSAATNWPYGSDPFYVVLSPGTASEEKVLVTRTNTGDTTINIASDAVRGLDGTSAVSHDAGATVYPVFTAVDADEANELAAMWESKGDLVSHGASTFSRLAVGADDTVLIADSSAGSGLSWGQVDTANIAADAVTNAKIAAGAVDTAELAAGAVTSAKIAAGAVTETELDSAVVSKLLPAGTIAATIKSSADTGWLLLDGTTVTGAQSTYPALWAVAPTAWKSGANLVLPTMANKMLFGQSTTTLGASGGANSKTIASANLPTHQHTIDHDHPAKVSSGQSQSHTHSIAHNHAAQTFSISTSPHDHTLTVYNAGAFTYPHSVNDFSGQGGTVAATINNFVSSVTVTGSVTVDLDNFTGSSGNASQDHTHTVDLDNFTGNSGDGGFANTALDVTNAHLAVNFQIKAH